MPGNTERLAVIGAGTMGHGIAYIAALAGYRVCLADANEAILAIAEKKIAAAFDKAIERGKATAEAKSDALRQLQLTTEPKMAVGDAAIVIEAVPENLELKRAIFSEVERDAPPDALLGTNTSSLSVSSIAQPLHRPDRFIGLHFFNPVPVMKLLEVVRGDATSDETVQRSRDLAGRLGKTPIVVRDTPGFATSRLGVVLGLEAIRMLEQGVASAEDIDHAMELGYNHPMGPLRLTDLVGLDIRLAIADHLHETFGEDTYRAPQLLRRMVAEGRLGKKSGRGFYEWEE